MNAGNQPQTSVSSDVLHIPSATKMTPEEIAKAVARHNKHHKPGSDKAMHAAQTGKRMK
jgi:hypothetical protein